MLENRVPEKLYRSQPRGKQLLEKLRIRWRDSEAMDLRKMRNARVWERERPGRGQLRRPGVNVGCNTLEKKIIIC